MLHQLVYYVGLITIFLYGLWLADGYYRHIEPLTKAHEQVPNYRLRFGRYVLLFLVVWFCAMAFVSRYEAIAIAPLIGAGVVKLQYVIEKRRVLKLAEKADDEQANA